MYFPSERQSSHPTIRVTRKVPSLVSSCVKSPLNPTLRQTICLLRLHVNGRTPRQNAATIDGLQSLTSRRIVCISFQTREKPPAKNRHWPEAFVLLALLQRHRGPFKLLRAYEGLKRHSRETCSHPLSWIAQLVLSQPRANRPRRGPGESHAPNKFGRLVALSVRELAVPHFRYTS